MRALQRGETGPQSRRGEDAQRVHQAGLQGRPEVLCGAACRASASSGVGECCAVGVGVCCVVLLLFFLCVCVYVRVCICCSACILQVCLFAFCLSVTVSVCRFNSSVS